MNRRVAVVGSGIAGLAAARALSADARVTLFEAGRHFGGHTNTVDLTLDGITHGVDTGFLVFNHRTYPHLVRLFDELEVETARELLDAFKAFDYPNEIGPGVYDIHSPRVPSKEEMTARRERALGRDLQFIRINGTLVGGLVGLAIHLVIDLLQRP